MKPYSAAAATAVFFLCFLAWQGIQANDSRIFWVAENRAPADFDGDGAIGFSDYLMFVTGFNTRAGEAGFSAQLDLNGDGRIDFEDFLAFVAVYGGNGSVPSVRTGYAVYVADIYESAVVVFDFDSHLQIDYLPFRIPIGVSISVDQNTIYVSDAFGLFALDTDHKVVFSVPTNSEGRFVLSPDERFAYVTEERNDLLRVVDLQAQATVDTIQVGDLPSDIDITPDGGLLCVTNLYSQDISIVDLARREVIGRIELGASPGELEIAPDGRRAYVAAQNHGSVSVLDLASKRLVGDIQLDGERTYGLAFSPDGKTLYVSSEGMLVAIDPERNLILRTLKVGDDSASLGISPDGSRTYVATMLVQGGGSGVTAVDLVNWRVMGRIRGISYPGDISFRKVISRQGTE